MNFEREPLFFEEHNEQETTEEYQENPPVEQQEPDVEIMCHIRNILDDSFPEENKGDPSFKIVHKHVVEYIARNCCHNFIKDYIDIDPDKGKIIEYCSLCFTIK